MNFLILELLRNKCLISCKHFSKKTLKTYFLKDIFAYFLIEFQDVCSENLVAGNCEVLDNINVMNDKPIKQAPRKFPLHLRQEVNRIIQKSQGMIEEYRSL